MFLHLSQSPDFKLRFESNFSSYFEVSVLVKAWFRPVSQQAFAIKDNYGSGRLGKQHDFVLFSVLGQVFDIKDDYGNGHLGEKLNIVLFNISAKLLP